MSLACIGKRRKFGPGRTSSTYSPSCRYSARTRRPAWSRLSTPGVFGRHQPVLDGEGDGADGAVAAHGQAAGGLDVEHADIAVGAGSADRGWCPTSCHGRAARTSARCGSSHISAMKCARRSIMVVPSSWGPPPVTSRTGLPQVVAVDAEECVAHPRNLSETVRSEGRQVDGGGLARDEIGDQAPGRRRLGEAEMAVAESIQHIRCAWRCANDRQRVRAATADSPSIRAPPNRSGPA